MNVILERHINTVLVALVTALLAWIGYTTHQTAVGVEVLNTKIEGVSVNSDRIAALEDRVRHLEQDN